MGHLIYAVGVDDGDDDVPLEHDIQRSAIGLHVHRVDLKRSVEELEGDIAQMGELILAASTGSALVG